MVMVPRIAPRPGAASAALDGVKLRPRHHRHPHHRRTMRARARDGMMRYLQVMADPATQLLAEALRLPVQERARLAAELIASVDGEPDSDAEAAWTAEVERRAERALAGQSTGSDWNVVRERIEGSLRSK